MKKIIPAKSINYFENLEWKQRCLQRSALAVTLPYEVRLVAYLGPNFFFFLNKLRKNNITKECFSNLSYLSTIQLIRLCAIYFSYID